MKIHFKYLAFKDMGKTTTSKQEQCTINGVRESALKWFNTLGLEEQFYKTIECNHLITGDRTRHPSTLTGLEIEKIYKYLHSL